MNRPTAIKWRRSVAATTLIALLIGIEVWALSTPMLRDLRVEFLGNRSARDVSMALDAVIVAPLLLLSLGLAWRWPSGLNQRLAPVLKTVRPVLRWVLGVPLALFILRQLLPGTNLIFILVLAEVALTIFLLVRMRWLYVYVRNHRAAGYSLVNAIIVAASNAFKGAPIVLALKVGLMELALLGYSLFGWFIRPRRDATSFSNHRREDDTVLIAFVILIALETIPVHFLLHPYFPVVAWVHLGLNAYSLMWLLGDIAARRHRRVLLFRDRIRFVRGLRAEAVVRLSDISAVESLPDGASVAEASIGTKPQFCLKLNQPVRVLTLFGMEKEARTLAIGVDSPVEFVTALAIAGVSVDATVWEDYPENTG